MFLKLNYLVVEIKIILNFIEQTMKLKSINTFAQKFRSADNQRSTVLDIANI